MASSYEVDDIHTIEYDMLDKKKYFPLVAINGFTVRGILYPVSLIKTRLQVQKHGAAYTGTFDAFGKIARTEGIKGLYKGFWISNLFIFSQMSYITTYEYVRAACAKHRSLEQNKTLRAFIAGGCASMVGQTFLVPVDIVSQHLQMLGTPNKTIDIPESAAKSRFGAAMAITQTVYRKYGLRGFYKGYMASISVYAPNSAMWWFSYQGYLDMISGVAPSWVPRLVIQAFLAAPMSGASVAVLFASMDAIRARVQVENTRFFDTARTLWREERYGIFTKGVSARLIQSCTFSFWIILFYEAIKRLSIKEEFRHQVKW